MSTADRDRLRSIRTFPSLVKYLRDELDWPIETDDFEDLTFDYAPEELIPDAKVAAKLQDIKQLRPLTSNQPWGIFFIKFEPKRLPIVVMRRILRSLVIKKRQSAQKAERPYWQMHDLLFVSSYGEQGDRVISFAHFSDPEGESLLPTLRVLAWDDKDTVLHLDHAHETLKAKLRWPDDEGDVGAWRTSWASAFTLRPREVIKTSKKLAVRMAEMATRMRNRANTILEIESESGPLTRLYKAFQVALIHDLTPDDFADMYAQTITYGLFAAAMSRTVPGEGTALVADNLADMVPVTNPFLKELLGTFLDVGGKRGHIDFDELGINDAVALLICEDTHLDDVLRDFGDLRQEEDPVIHFYEDFLREYDAKKKIQRGVFFTPQPVVSFIVRSVDEILRTEFGLEDGLADTTTWGEMVERHPDLELPRIVRKKLSNRSKVEYEPISSSTPFVQVLDPACGTGTFLVEVIDLINRTMAEKWRREGHMDLEIPDLWNEYVPKHLLPRLYGFELMMAPYTICHMKVGLKLDATGYRFGSDERARVYLTNSLEPAQDFSGTLAFAIPALAHEAEAVNAIKRDQRFTVVVGNPPYFAEAGRGGDWISSLMRGYDREHGSRTYNYFEVSGGSLGERTTKWINDDYVKFLRLAQHFIGLAGAGILGFITNHSYLDNPTFRGVRESLLALFRHIFVLDLHGNSTKRECCPDGSPDTNVFDIKQGVAISLFCSPLSPDCDTRVCWGEKWGLRDKKYSSLSREATLPSSELDPAPPHYLLIPESAELRGEFESGISIADLFSVRSHGIITKRDGLALDFTAEEIWAKVNEFAQCPPPEAYVRFNLPDDVRDWSVVSAQEDLAATGLSRERVQRLCYRPFNYRYTYYTGNARGFLGWPVDKVMSHMLAGDNVALVATRQTKDDWGVLVTRHLVGHKACGAYDVNTVFPLFLYARGDGFLMHNAGSRERAEGSRKPNFNLDIIRLFEEAAGLKCVGSATDAKRAFTAEDLFGYIYATFHSPAYRSRYQEFLKTSFPRFPVPSRLQLFRDMSFLGNELIALHLMDSPDLVKHSTILVGSGDLQVEKVSYSDGTVWIDKAKTRGFQRVPEEVWDFHIGGFQVCEKWLKDRQAKGGKNPRPGRVLTDEDIDHYQKIIVAISETIRIMGEIDGVIEEHGGWPGAFITEPLDTESKEASTAVSAPRPASKTAKKQNPGKGNFKLRPNTRTVTGRLALSARKKQPKQRSRGKAPSITDFDRDQLKAALLEVVGTDWIERDDVIRAAARHLGFKRCGKRIHKAFASAITGLLRQNRLEYDGSLVRRSP